MKKMVIIFSLILFIVVPKNVYADSANASIVMDLDSGRILYQNNINDKRLIASITKIMTCLIAIENGDIDKKITAGEEILSMYGSNIYLQLNEKMTLRDLLYGLMLRSGNDAAVVIANHVAKDEKEFVKLMNKKAKEIGMKNTTFANCHGLDEETKNYSTAYDMATLTQYAFNKYPLFREIFGTEEYEVKSNEKTYLWYNRNKLLKEYEFCTGGKTGYTPSAGKTLVTTAEKDNLKLVVVSLHDDDTYTNHKNLYENIFSRYQNYKIIDKTTYELDNHMFEDTLYIKDEFSYPLSEEEFDEVKTIMKIHKDKGYKNNDEVGKITIKLKDEKIGEVSVYVKEKKKEKSFFEKLKSLFI